MVLKYNTQQASSYRSTRIFSLHGWRISLLSRCADQIRTGEYIEMYAFSQFKNSYGKVGPS